MLETHAPVPRWYQSRWVWAAGAALVVAAVLVPITASVASDRTPTTADGDLGNPAGWAR
jgi:hypothetical protein